MDWDDALPWSLLLTLGAIALALRSMVVQRRLRARIDALTDKLAMLDHRVFRINERLEAGGQGLAPSPDAPPAVEVTPEQTSEPVASEPIAPEPLVPELAAAAVASPVSAAPSRDLRNRFEQRLVENWLVWLGGVTLALGGAFLVKLSIDYGLLTPPVRIVLAVLLGIGLCLGAGWLARREPAGSSGPSYVPQALAAAGAATVFASLYAAYQLYALIPGGLAFPLLAATAAATVALSLQHGPMVAALGLIGAYVVPALVTSDAPHALPLFAYLGVVTAAVLAVLRHRAWWWLAWPTLLGAFGWIMAWLALQPQHPEAAVVGIYVLAQLTLFAGFRRGVPRVGFLAGTSESPMVVLVVRLAVALFAIAAFVLVHVDAFSNAGLGTSFAAAAFILGLAYRDRELDDIIATATVLLLAILASWNLPLLADQDLFMAVLRLPVEIGDFLTTCAIAAVLLGGGGYLAQMRAPRPGRWAAMSVAGPVLLLVIAYWRLHPYGLDLGWSTVALVLAGPCLAAAASVVPRRDGATETEIALAAYAVGVLAGTILAATFALSTAWLTVALALHLPAIGWVEGRIPIKVLRRLALGVTAIVLLRLAANPYLLDYPISAPIFNWLLYGYGVPALAFIVATRQFGSRADDALVGVLEAGSILFTSLLLTLELRHALYGRLAAPYSDLGRDALNPLLWLALSGFLLWLGERRQRPVLRWSGIILFGLASAQVALWQVLIANPLFTGEAVGRAIGFDVLTLAYGLPAIAYAGMAVLRIGPKELRVIARILAAGLAFLWLTLEIRHVFQGEILTWGSSSDGEWYTYSAAWLVFAGIGLAVGLIRRDDWLRRVSLAAVGLVIAKVFLSDMAELEGVLRALSFLGLGGALIGIGYAYRRLRPLQNQSSEDNLPLMPSET